MVYNSITARRPVSYFASDQEFEDFCVAPYAEIKETADGVMYVSGKYSEEYLECLEDGVRFVIRDEDSVVYKRQCVCKRVPVMHNSSLLGRDTLVQLKVENLEPYFDLWEHLSSIDIEVDEDVEDMVPWPFE